MVTVLVPGIAGPLKAVRGRVALQKHSREKFMEDVEFYFAKLRSAHASSRRFFCRDQSDAFSESPVRRPGYARFLSVTSLPIKELPAVVKAAVEAFLENYPRSPAARMRPRMGMVGDTWLVFIGSKLRQGASNLGPTTRGALEDFNLRCMEPVILRNGSSRE